MRRLAALALAAAAAAVGCGGANDEEAMALLERGFSTDVRSGVLFLTIGADLQGLPLVSGPIDVHVTGPFAGVSEEGFPDFDFEVRIGLTGREQTGGAVATRGNGWVEFQGETYEVGEDRWRELEREALAEGGPGSSSADPLDWIRNAETAGTGTVEGVRCTRVVADLDVAEALAAFAEEAEGEAGFPSGEQLEAVDGLIERSRLEAWIGDDGTWRRVRLELDLDVPEERRDDLGGLKGGEVVLEAALSEPNRPQEIARPDDARPLADLLGKLGLGPLLLLPS